MAGLGLGIGRRRRRNGGGVSTATFLPTLATAPAAVYATHKLVSGYAGPVMVLRRADGTGSPLDVFPVSGGQAPDFSGVAAWSGGTAVRGLFYDQLTGVALTQATLADQPRLLHTVPEYGLSGLGFLATTTAMVLPAGLATARAGVTMAAVVGGSEIGVVAGLGSDAGATNNLSIVGQTGGRALLGNSFASSSLPLSVDATTLIAVSGSGAASMRVGARRVAVTAQSALALTGGRIGQAGGASFQSPIFQRHHGFIVYPAALSVGDETSLNTTLTSIFGLTTAFTDQVAFVGNSLTFAQGASLGQSVAHLLSPNLSRRCFIPNYGVSGATFASMAAATYSAAAYPNKQILVCTIGANDINTSRTGAALWADITAWIAARKAQGWIVVMGTITPWTSWPAASAKDNERLAYNQLLRDNAVSGGFSVVDYANASGLTDAANATFYTDGTHNTDAGYAAREVVLRPVVNGLL